MQESSRRRRINSKMIRLGHPPMAFLGGTRWAMSISPTVEFAPLALKILTQKSVLSMADSLGFRTGIAKSLTSNEQLYFWASSICFASNSTLSDGRDKRVDRREINFFVSLQLALRSSYSSPKKLRDFSGSTWIQEITCGIPQGSLFGPLFLLLHLNDLCRVSNALKFLLFADDTNILLSGKDPDPLIDSANFELSEIVTWFQANKLSLNIHNIIYCIHHDNGITLCQNHYKSMAKQQIGYSRRPFQELFLQTI